MSVVRPSMVDAELRTLVRVTTLGVPAVRTSCAANVIGIGASVIWLLVTAMLVEPVTVPTVAEMMAVPDTIAVANPVFAPTEATAVFVELQLAAVVTAAVVPSLYVAVATNCCVLPATTLGLAGVTAMDVIPFPPVPPSASDWGLPPPSSVSSSEALNVPILVGVKVTRIEQLAPPATCVPQVLDWMAKFVLFAPVMAMPDIFKSTVLTFVRVIVCGVVVILIGRVPQV
jgi:hypothetical protein